MEQREKLIEVLRYAGISEREIDAVADCLIANGVVAIPHKVYKPWPFIDSCVDEYKVTEYSIKLYAKCSTLHEIFYMSEIGANIFFTKEEAERALEKRKGGNE